MEPVRVEVIPLGFLQIPAGSGRVSLEIPPGTTVRSALSKLNLNRDVVLNVAINGTIAGIDSVLQDGDEVKLMPYTGGG